MSSKAIRITLGAFHLNPDPVNKITPFCIDGLSIGAALAIGVTLWQPARVSFSAAIETVKQWVYWPYFVNREATEVHTKTSVAFNLGSF